MSIPLSFICPITQAVMVDPVIDKEGNSWERQSILDWIAVNHSSPLTRNLLEAIDLSPNRALKDLIEAFQRGENVQIPEIEARTLVSGDINDEFKITCFLNEKKVLINLEPSESLIRTPVDVACVIDIR
jgi:U-box domain